MTTFPRVIQFPGDSFKVPFCASKSFQSPVLKLYRVGGFDGDGARVADVLVRTFAYDSPDNSFLVDLNDGGDTPAALALGLYAYRITGIDLLLGTAAAQTAVVGSVELIALDEGDPILFRKALLKVVRQRLATGDHVITRMSFLDTREVYRIPMNELHAYMVLLENEIDTLERRARGESPLRIFGATGG